MYQQLNGVLIFRKKVFNPFQASLAFHIKTSHLVWFLYEMQQCKGSWVPQIVDTKKGSFWMIDLNLESF